MSKETYAGRIKTNAVQDVKALFTQKPTAQPKVSTGGDLRARPSAKKN